MRKKMMPYLVRTVKTLMRKDFGKIFDEGGSYADSCI
jgi:hypothetical protein